MKKKSMVRGGSFAAMLVACGSGSTPSSGEKDASPRSDGNTPKLDAAADSGATDAGQKGNEAGAEGGAVTRHVLVTYDGTSPTTMFAVDVATGAIDGKVTTLDTQAITDTTNSLAPFLLNQSLDTIDRIDPASWTVDGSWSVALPGDSGGAYSDPYAVVVASESQVYAIRYLSNVIDIFDMTKPADGGKRTGVIDLSSLVQPADKDGNVEATGAVYVASSKLLYVVLGNIDTYATDAYMGSFDTICVSTKSSVIAIDTVKNKVVTLGGAAPGGGIALEGYDPSSVVYDAKGSRLLVFEAGCNPAPTADGGPPGMIRQRGVEQVDLTSKTSKILLDASAQGFPGNLVYIDETHAAIGFIYPSYAAFAWDPTSTTLGASLPNAPQTFDYDGNGNLVGASVDYGDGGTATTDILSMSLATGKVTTLQSNVIVLGGAGYVGSVGVWPRP
jgi:hypothetical protein